MVRGLPEIRCPSYAVGVYLRGSEQGSKLEQFILNIFDQKIRTHLMIFKSLNIS